jgi:uncharacterized protein YjbI with pentapeptide repeats
MTKLNIFFSLIIATFYSIHAGEMVAAGKIIKMINDGKPVSFQNVRIVGDLEFISVEEKERDRSRIRLGDYDTYLCHIGSTISFINCTFEGKVMGYLKDDFTKQGHLGVFHEKVEFRGCKFMDEWAFRHSDFLKEADFRDSDFFKKTVFRHVNFKHTVNFAKSQFLKQVDFRHTDFFREAIFKRAEFKEDADFRHADFHDGVIYEESFFHEDSDFRHADFRYSASFKDAQFDGSTDFKHAKVRGHFSPRSLLRTRRN